MEIKKVAIIGCGAMGSGIARVALQSGYEVIAREADPSFPDKGVERVRASFEKLVKK